MDAYTPRIERMMSACITRWPRMIVDGMRPSSPQSWVMAGSSTSPAFCNAIPRPSAEDWRNWKKPPIWIRVVSEKKGLDVRN